MLGIGKPCRKYRQTLHTTKKASLLSFLLISSKLSKLLNFLMMSINEGKDLLFQDPWLKYGRVVENKDNQRVINKCVDNLESSSSSISSNSSSFESSTISGESSSSIDTIDDDGDDDDASSSVTCLSSSSNSDEGSYDLSELMAELPIKRGLSKYYQGKSESFTCLARVTSIEDLAKKAIPYKRKMMKSSKSYGGLHAYKPYTIPKSVLLKKSSVDSLSSFLSK